MRLELPELTLPTPRAPELIGKWHIVRTTFPMWRSGKNTRPTLNYALIEGPGPARLEDRVIYQKHGKPKTIRGVDVQDPDQPCHFTWRGRGLLALLSSEWFVVDLDLDAGVMAIYFSETLFTPAGLDIATSAAKPERAAVDACAARIRAAALLRSHVDALVEIAH